MKRRLSVISPVYNEGEGLRIYFRAMVERISTGRLAKYDVEVILVDNASTDDSALYLEEIAAADPRFKILFNARNVGVFLSSFNALRFARGDAVFLMVPSDLQDPLDLMEDMVASWEGGALLTAGRRLQRDESPVVRRLRNLFYRMMERIADQPMRPGVGEYQLADRRIVDELLAIPDAAPFVRGMLSELGYEPVLIDYVWARRQWGRSSFGMRRLLRTAYDMTFSFSRLPLKLIMRAGLLIALVSLVFVVVQLGIILFEGRVAGRGVTTLIVGLFFFSGINAMFLGVIGEYVGRIYQQLRYGRRVALRRKLNFDELPQPSGDIEAVHAVGDSKTRRGEALL